MGDSERRERRERKKQTAETVCWLTCIAILIGAFVAYAQGWITFGWMDVIAIVATAFFIGFKYWLYTHKSKGKRGE